MTRDREVLQGRDVLRRRLCLADLVDQLRKGDIMGSYVGRGGGILCLSPFEAADFENIVAAICNRVCGEVPETSEELEED